MSMIFGMLLLAQTLVPPTQIVFVQGMAQALFTLTSNHSDLYCITASLSGSSPGTLLPPPVNITVPINYDQISCEILEGLHPEFERFGIDYIYEENGIRNLIIYFPMTLGLSGIQVFVGGFISNTSGYFAVGPCVVYLI